MIQALRFCRFEISFPRIVLCELSVGGAVGSACTVSLLSFALLIFFCSGAGRMSICSVLSSFICDSDMDGWASVSGGLATLLLSLSLRVWGYPPSRFMLLVVSSGTVRDVSSGSSSFIATSCDVVGDPDRFLFSHVASFDSVQSPVASINASLH